MDNLTHNVKEKMQKTYSFTGTQLLITGIGIIILLSIFASAGRGHGGRGMMNHDMRGGRQEKMQQYDTQSSDGEQKQDMIRGQSNNQIIDNQDQSTTNQDQSTPSDIIN